MKEPIMDTPSDLEVRRKLIDRGVETLSDPELLSILIGSGAGTHSALDLAGRILENAQWSLVKLSGEPLSRLRMIEGIGVRRAATIAAAMELGRRRSLEQLDTPSIVSGSEDVVKMFRAQMADLAHEEFWVVYLTSANTVLDKVRVSQGGVSEATVDHKLIIKRAVELLASAFILVHNHPSGIASPSETDKLLTRKIIASASLFEIDVLDHLIIAGGDAFSFRASGLI